VPQENFPAERFLPARPEGKNRMKTIGILGGIAPESTIQYYRGLITEYRRRTLDGSYPSIAINSIDMKTMLNLTAMEDKSGLIAYLAGEVERLARAGVDFALMASNTPHIVFDDVQRRVSIPLISIVEEACREAQTRGIKRAGLFGTRFTMNSRFYADVFTREGIAVVVPTAEEQEYIHTKYMDELVAGVFLPATRDGMRTIAADLRDRDGIDGLVLGGTELPLLLPEAGIEGLPFLDTTSIHVDAAIGRMIS
jgi:aspartate racemase